MALKSKVTKAEFDALPDILKAEYTANGDGYLLQTDDLTELRNAKAREKQRADELAAQLAEKEAERVAAETAAREAAEEAARKAKDLPALEASWQSKVDAAKTEGKAALDGVNKKLEALLVDNKAIEICNAIAIDAGAAKLLMPHVKARLKAETEGDVAITRVLDADGKPSAATIDDLQKEFVANKDFAAIIKGSNATGGGAGSHGGGGGGATGKKLSDLSEKERVAMARDNPTEWARVKAEAGIRT